MEAAVQPTFSKSLDTSGNDERYFKTPKPSQVEVPSKKPLVLRKSKSRTVKTKISRYFAKKAEPRSSAEDQLQTAIALSTSLCSQENVEVEGKSTSPLSLKETLAKFGFKAGSSLKINLEDKWSNSEVSESTCVN